MSHHSVGQRRSGASFSTVVWHEYRYPGHGWADSVALGIVQMEKRVLHLLLVGSECKHLGQRRKNPLHLTSVLVVH
jgi:hypothetical protein